VFGKNQMGKSIDVTFFKFYLFLLKFLEGKEELWQTKIEFEFFAGFFCIVVFIIHQLLLILMF